MKRLLAYLFIVFGLGLVFNVNAKSAKFDLTLEDKLLLTNKMSAY